MKVYFKKIVASMLVLISLAVWFSLPASATTYIGLCGENIKWNLDTGTGLLTIDGSGEMYSFYSSADVPWSDYGEFVKKAEISNGITNLSPYSFYRLSNLTAVNIPKSVKSIGERAFYGCSRLAEVKFSENSRLETIDRYAFGLCRNLKKIEIPNKVESVGEGAFYFCYNLPDIVLGYSVKQVGSKAFSGCSNLKKIRIVNNKCDIFDDNETIYSAVKIEGFKKSTAKAYADKYLRSFKTIKDIKNIEDLKIKLSYTSVIYNGKVRKPTVTVKGLKRNRDFTVDYQSNKKPGIAYVTVSAAGTVLGERTLTFEIRPQKPSNITVKSRKKTSLELSWDKVYGASGYRVYMLKDGKWKAVGDSKGTSLKIGKLSASKVYSFKVRAYVNTEERKLFGEFSKTFITATNLGETEISVSAPGRRRLSVKWERVQDADGYIIYTAGKKNGNYKEAAVISGGYRTGYTLRGLKSEKDYYVTVRAYIKAGDNRVLSGNSNKVKITVM